MSIDTLCVCSFNLILSFFIIFILVYIIRHEQLSMCTHSIPGDGGQAKFIGSVTNTFLIVYFVGILEYYTSLRRHNVLQNGTKYFIRGTTPRKSCLNKNFIRLYVRTLKG